MTSKGKRERFTLRISEKLYRPICEEAWKTGQAINTVIVRILEEWEAQRTKKEDNNGRA